MDETTNFRHYLVLASSLGRLPVTQPATNQTAVGRNQNPVRNQQTGLESSVAAGLSLTKGNSDTLLATLAFRTHTKTPRTSFRSA